jgi:hypothetical protein
MSMIQATLDYKQGRNQLLLCHNHLDSVQKAGIIVIESEQDIKHLAFKCY